MLLTNTYIMNSAPPTPEDVDMLWKKATIFTDKVIDIQELKVQGYKA